MALEVDIEKQLGDFRLRVAFTVGNERLALLGASGCGKSITLQCVAGIIKPDKGRIAVDGQIWFDSARRINLKPQARRAGYLFQNYALFPNMTVEQNIAAGMRLGPRERQGLIAEKIRAFHLQGLEKHYPVQLSGGQQQRVALARMLAAAPQIILLDEPFSALDSYLRWQLEQELVDTLDQFAGGVVFVSHDRDEAYRLCDRIAVMSGGAVDVIADKHEIFSAPRTLAGALITGCKNISRAEKRGDRDLFAVDWGLRLLAAAAIPDDIRHVGIRAHHIEAAGADLANAVRCRIRKIVETPFAMIVMLQPGEAGDIARTADAGSGLRWEIDKNIWQKMDISDSRVGQGVEVVLPAPALLLLR
ncbi:MAG: ATP-binding cassette domain-containing protein [Gracilibacteraceae bacterium]|jgi:molybdate transport system ATP-binding protein|nr:ATP-binding cassette domain-containing protein [Gracilibacteraceae bacterium]